MRVEFISANGGKMFVDESRIEEYKGRGFLLASDVIDVEVKDSKPKRTTKKKTEEV